VAQIPMCCDSLDAEYAECADAGLNSTFCLMPTVHISYNISTIVWAIQFKLPASLTKGKFLELC